MHSERVVDRRVFNFWVHLSPASDVPGTWVAHCLDFDIVSCGQSPRHAMEMVREAVSISLIDDLNEHDEVRRRRAPEEYWERLYRIQAEGQKVQDLQPPPGSGERKGTVFEFAVYSEMAFECIACEMQESAPSVREPLAMARAA